MSIKTKLLSKSLLVSFLFMFTMSGYAGFFSGWNWGYDPYYGTQCPGKCKRPYIKTLDNCQRVARLDNCGYVKSVSTFERCDKCVKKYKKGMKYKKCGCKNNYYRSWF